MTTLILACVVTTGLSNVVLAVPNPPSPYYAHTECRVYATLKEAAVAQFERSHTPKSGLASYYNETESSHTEYYKVTVGNPETLSIEPISAPKVRIEVDEK